MHAYRTHTCAALTKADVGTNVRLSGWVHRVRDHGGILFIDLRDHYGVTQVLCDPDSPAFAAVEKVRSEWCIRIDGEVKARDASLVNPKLPTGEIEVFVRDIEVLGPASELPLMVFGDQEYPEETRLRYRYLDLRRDNMQDNMKLRSDVVRSMRQRMWDKGFREYQTPIITASSPEGARDFLVPSRLHPGKFYALPQAPQQFKQLIMVAGFDRYFQIAPCFRDEASRADRSPGEFYQLDFEMSFVTQEDVFAAIEPVLAGVFEEFSDWSGTKRAVTPAPFPRIPYQQAMLEYGSDKPDLRNPIKITDVSTYFAGGGFGLFAKVTASGGVVRAIPAPGAAGRPRSFFDGLNEWARAEGQGGLGYIAWDADGAKGPIAKNLEADRVAAIAAACGLGAGDAVFFVANKEAEAAKFSGAVRNRVGRDLGLLEENAFRFCWVTDFPMYERNEDTGQIEFSHNPFSMPQGGLEALNSMDPLDIKAFQYDIVCNGIELSSGAIRNHRPDIMIRAFEIAGYPAEEVEHRFGGMLNAFRYGAPPHGGSAPGIDRIVMLIADEPAIREVILFPMNQQAEDLMMGAPARVPPERLKELHIKLDLPPVKGGKPG